MEVVEDRVDTQTGMTTISSISSSKESGNICCRIICSQGHHNTSPMIAERQSWWTFHISSPSFANDNRSYLPYFTCIRYLLTSNFFSGSNGYSNGGSNGYSNGSGGGYGGSTNGYSGGGGYGGGSFGGGAGGDRMSNLGAGLKTQHWGKQMSGKTYTILDTNLFTQISLPSPSSKSPSTKKTPLSPAARSARSRTSAN